MQLAKRIRALRYAKGLGLKELATRAELSKQALYKIELGSSRMPRAATLLKIAQALGVPLDDLLDPEPNARHEGQDEVIGAATRSQAANPPVPPTRQPPKDRVGELMWKFLALLASPLADGVAGVVDDSFRLLSITTPPAGGNGSGPPPVNQQIGSEPAGTFTPPNRQNPISESA
jgi:transcriptional regulator with XRE-family HTH domain